DLERDHSVATEIASHLRGLSGVSEVYVPQELEYPSLRLNVDRIHAGQLGLSQREVVNNVVTALTSNGMIAPSYWIDPKSGNDYMLTVQYPEGTIQGMPDLKGIPLRSPGQPVPATLDAVTTIARAHSPAEVDHYQIQRVIDVYVSPSGEDL